MMSSAAPAAPVLDKQSVWVEIELFLAVGGKIEQRCSQINHHLGAQATTGGGTKSDLAMVGNEEGNEAAAARCGSGEEGGMGRGRKVARGGGKAAWAQRGAASAGGRRR